MGIRYHAYAISEQFADPAAADPAAFLRDGPFCCCRYDGEAPLTLDLDKAWDYLQRVLRTHEGEAPRAAFELVDGQVTNTCCGWRSFYRYLTPAQVSSAADDLAQVDECQVLEELARGRTLPDDRYADDVDYTLSYLSDAVEFTRRLAERREGMLYVIG